jgi:hypothetical protein
MRRISLLFVAPPLLGLAFPAVPLAACGTSSSGSPIDASAADAEASALEAGAFEGAADAGPDIEQDPNVYPAKHQPIPQIDYNGGAILQHMRVVTVTFTGNPHRDDLRVFDHLITSTDWWRQTAEGFCADGGVCVGDGTSVADDGGAWHPNGSTDDGGDGYLDVELAYDFPTLGDSGLSTVDDSQIQVWLGRHIAAGDFPAPDDQTVYALYFPPTTTITLQGAPGCTVGGWEAYHSSGAVLDGGSQQVAYAVLPLCDIDGMGPTSKPNYYSLTISASHELAEAATDPHPGADTGFSLHSNDAWLGALSYGGGENGDMCTYLADPSYLESGVWRVQRIWSNTAAAASKNPCQPESKLYFGAAVRTTPLKLAGGRTSDGYVVVRRGQSVEAIADVFSEAPLLADVLISVGTNQGATLGLPDPLQVDLSAQQVHNGNGMILTITAPARMPPGDHHLVVRSTYMMGEYNDWPFIVRVQ